MAKEIERKYLTVSDSYRTRCDKADHIIQGYLSTAPDATVRVRIKNSRAYLTVKGKNDGIVRDEWEYEIPIEDAREMLERCCKTSIIEKKRYVVGRWEIDEFLGERSGLTIAEIELKSADERIELPDFIGKEVTGDPRYYNSVIARQSNSK